MALISGLLLAGNAGFLPNKWNKLRHVIGVESMVRPGAKRSSFSAPTRGCASEPFLSIETSQAEK